MAHRLMGKVALVTGAASNFKALFSATKSIFISEIIAYSFYKTLDNSHIF